ncbi:MAG TPA: hypothetical protein PLX23_10320 [Candidatus Hydrogenedens sp.]|nr:hypothetical protein [Candidatus Hydrogenedens sp.]
MNEYLSKRTKHDVGDYLKSQFEPISPSRKGTKVIKNHYITTHITIDFRGKKNQKVNF